MKKTGLIIFCALILFSSAYAREEELTITTYYPSPYGSYQQLYIADTLGIGTTSPTSGYKLDVNGSARVRGSIALDGTLSDPYGTDLFIGDGDDRVGIGSPSLTEKLNVDGNIKLGAANPYIDFNGNAKIILTGADKLDFQGITSTNVCVLVSYPCSDCCPAGYFTGEYMAKPSGSMLCCMVG